MRPPRQSWERTGAASTAIQWGGGGKSPMKTSVGRDQGRKGIRGFKTYPCSRSEGGAHYVILAGINFLKFIKIWENSGKLI